ncbi:MAG: homocysteine S-methyltransferase family protein [Clostridia bacterium]|nr:homocysteine S-methyltransferase family protein [Clostridia bacterium]
MKKITELIKEKRLYFDGGTGTVLQSMGLPPGRSPELWNLEQPGKIISLHNAYFDAGCNIIKTNTFGVNRCKFANYRELIAAGIGCAKKAAQGREEAYVAYDVGPTGRLLEPLGDLSFDEAVSIFADNIKAAAGCGADLVLIETMNDSLETKAAVLAAKENCDLPVFVTNVYDASGKLMTGADPLAMIAMLEGLRVDALGMNCSLGPDKMLEIIGQFREYSSTPVIVNPNAGLPEVRDGRTVFNIDADEFSDYMVSLAESGACILGGCCGTTPEFIAKTIAKTRNLPYAYPEEKDITVVSSYTHGVVIGKDPVLIGERINPTGKSKLKAALRSGDLNYILNEAIRQSETGAHVLDVNVGLPEIDETAMMLRCVSAIQSVSDLPLQIDSTKAETLEASLRMYNGKAFVNSVNGTEDSMNAVLPVVQKYGGVLIALTIDESGIPDNAADRVRVAQRIIERASEYGIKKKDIVVDPLALTISSNPESAAITLEAVRRLGELGIKTSLGISNISFGLPKRELITATFYANALQCGLNCAIMNPFSEVMMNTYYTYRALHGLDKGCTDYIAYASAEGAEPEKKPAADNVSLHSSIVKGLKDQAVSCAASLLNDTQPLDVINLHIVPALNEIGEAFEKKKAYLPQLLMSAEAASAAFEEVKKRIPADKTDKSKAIVLATVKGDIHDIGKNIVKVLMESYGFTVYDLGRDVPPERVLACALENNCKLVGLSALMTTTVPAMAETIELLKKHDPDFTAMVGGAVLNQEYADMIGADYYGADAMDSVRFAQRYYGAAE